MLGIVAAYHRLVALSPRCRCPSGSRRSALVAATTVVVMLELGTTLGASAQEGLDLLHNAPAVVDSLERAPPKRTGKDRFFDPADGQLDLSYFLDTKGTERS